ncbi:isocitrate lyase/phosphoenolpyruvate mutase family protein, partial [Streptomyces sp. NPDC054808]
MTAFAALHRAGAPLLLPCAWDHASALALAGHGFRAVGTTSLGVAASAGQTERAAATPDDNQRGALTHGEETVHISVDSEG